MIYFYKVWVKDFDKLNVVIASSVEIEDEYIFRNFLEKSCDHCLGIKFASNFRQSINYEIVDRLSDLDDEFEEWKDVLPYNYKLPDGLEFTPKDYFSGKIHNFIKNSEKYKKILKNKHLFEDENIDDNIDDIDDDDEN